MNELLLIAEHYARPHRGPEDLQELGTWMDSSKLSEFHLCPQRYAFRYEEHLKRDYSGPDAASFGTGLHAGLAVLYRGDGFELIPCPNHEEHTICELCRKRDGMVTRIVGEFLRAYPWTEVDGLRTQEKGVDLLQQYIRKWSNLGILKLDKDADGILRNVDDAIVGVEKPFLLAFRNLNGDTEFFYLGRIDLLRRIDGELVPEDHKSTSRFGFLFEAQFKVSYQMTGYMRAASVIAEEPVHRATIDALRVTPIISSASFERFDTYRWTEEEFARFDLEVMQAVKAIKQHREIGIWPRHMPFACSAYQKQCPYYAICTSDVDTAEHLKQTAYSKEVWNPLAERTDNDGS